jgi:hypothetical protein
VGTSMQVIFKRLINLVSIIAILALSLFIVMMISGSVANWVVFTEINLLPLVLVFIFILAVNYVAFGKLTIWHKSVK